MAVYQGTRLRADALSGPELPARRARVAAAAGVGAAPRVRPMGLLMAAIVATMMLGLVYLTQILGTNATATEIVRLQSERNKLVTDIKRQEIQALDMSQAEVILPRARELKLKWLGEPIVLPAP